MNPNDHPPAFVLEQISVEEGGAALASERDHVAHCERCQGYIDALQSSRDSFLSGTDPEAFVRALHAPAPSERKSRWISILAGLAVAAAAAAIILAIPTGTPTPSPDPAGDIVRLKGAPVQLAVVVNRGGVQTRQIGPVVSLRSGDGLRIEVTAASESLGHGVVVGIYDPSAGDPWFVVSNGTAFGPQAVFLEQALSVDDQPMNAWIIAGPKTFLESAARAGTLQALVDEALGNAGESSQITVLRLQTGPPAGQ